MRSLSGKTAIVTGAGHCRGIGHAIAIALAERGANVVVTDLSTEQSSLDLLANEIRQRGVQALAIAVDVTDPVQVGRCVSMTVEQLGGVDILANNAGVGIGSPNFLEQTDSDWDISFAVNVKGMARFAQAVIPEMQKRATGVIINTASLCGLRNIPPTPPAYTVSKFAVIGLTKAIAQEFGPHGIRCNAVCPGSIDTQMRTTVMNNIMSARGISRAQAEAEENSTIALGRPAQPAEVAAVVAFLAGPESAYITGAAIPVDGGMFFGL